MYEILQALTIIRIILSSANNALLWHIPPQQDEKPFKPREDEEKLKNVGENNVSSFAQPSNLSQSPKPSKMNRGEVEA